MLPRGSPEAGDDSLTTDDQVHNADVLEDSAGVWMEAGSHHVF
jgi:hypothetical protein